MSARSRALVFVAIASVALLVATSVIVEATIEPSFRAQRALVYALTGLVAALVAGLAALSLRSRREPKAIERARCIARRPPDARAAEPPEERAPSRDGYPPDPLSDESTARALARLDGNEQLLRRLREQFLRIHQTTRDELRTAWDQGDEGRVRFLAHKVKGGAAAIGAEALASAAASLEEASSELATEGGAARIEAFERALGDTLARLDGARAATSPA